jgi:hypothetical protein
MPGGHVQFPQFRSLASQKSAIPALLPARRNGMATPWTALPGLDRWRRRGDVEKQPEEPGQGHPDEMANDGDDRQQYEEDQEKVHGCPLSLQFRVGRPRFSSDLRLGSS